MSLCHDNDDMNFSGKLLILVLNLFLFTVYYKTSTPWTASGIAHDGTEGSVINTREEKMRNYHLISKRSTSLAARIGNMSQIFHHENKTMKRNETFCTPPSIQEFPNDIFNDAQRRSGAVVLHILVSIYMFIALAFVCDDYFVASLDHICENLHLSEDVAGATFMAIGGSAPELFTSIIGLFVIGYGDVGPGTIVGSAVFNILVALALVSLFAGQETQLTYWPMCRDSFSYSIAVAALIGAMYDGYISWYESVIMLLLYVCYCLLMRFNAEILRKIKPEEAAEKNITERNPLTAENVEYGSNDGGNVRIPLKYTINTVNVENVQETSVKKRFERCLSPTSTVRKLSWREVGMMVMLSEKFHPSTRFRAACYMITMRLYQDDKPKGLNGDHKTDDEEQKREADHVDIQLEAGPFYLQEQSCLGKTFWIISRPIAIVLYFTIPDCKTKKWARWYMVTFCMSILWIGVLSYIMVWMVVIIGYTLRIPDVIMGITFLAAGTSIPDALASLIVARQGQGDMAVANSIGSNVFDILIGLALPWFIQTCLLNPGSMVKVNSRGLIYSVILLFTTVFITILSIHVNRWKLDKKTGLTFVIAYLIFITFSSFIEFNVFGFVNLPTCSMIG